MMRPAMRQYIILFSLLTLSGICAGKLKPPQSVLASFTVGYVSGIVQFPASSK